VRGRVSHLASTNLSSNMISGSKNAMQAPPKPTLAFEARGRELGLNDEELAFYDALAENGSARELMAHEQLRVLTRMLA
jgi:hypothetical protein